MPGDKYEKYGRPLPPVDPHADVMNIQETAYVLNCSVTHLRRGIKAGKYPHGRIGRRIVTNRADRERIYEIDRVPAKRVPRKRLTPAA